jgi:type I restriction enzyme S subunit
MNETLDEIARTLFTSWFVTFDPVRAKADGRQPEGMDAETAALFPDRFVDSELGPIPEGWEVKALDEIGDFLNGLALQKYPPRGDDTDLPAIKIAQLRVNNTSSASTANNEVPPKYVIEDGDFLFSWSGSLLATIWSGGKGALNQHLFKVTSTYPHWFIYHWVQEHIDHFRSIAADKATTMGHINRHHLSRAKCVVPRREMILDQSNRVVGDLMKLALNNSLESRTLSELRDTLLPELISGRVRVSEEVR